MSVRCKTCFSCGKVFSAKTELTEKNDTSTQFIEVPLRMAY